MAGTDKQNNNSSETFTTTNDSDNGLYFRKLTALEAK